MSITTFSLSISFKILGCQYDIVLLMDFSGGTEDKRTSYTDLASSLIKTSALSIQVCMVRYSGPGREDTVFHLNKHIDSIKAIEEMNSASHLGGTTRTGEAIRYTIDEFSEKNGGRAHAVKMMIVFTDGYSQDEPAVAAKEAQKLGINIRVVAIEDENLPPNRNQLNEIAGNPKVPLLNFYHELLLPINFHHKIIIAI
uniref:VWFA domain-containing protein n=1 Tax=Syphacia muris TaxID=451379 RepID=A0A0N5AXZ5_9BILA